MHFAVATPDADMHLFTGAGCVGVSCLQHLGRVHVAAFSDTLLHNELISKALFWQQTSFYGIDMTPLHQPAVDGYFTQVGLHKSVLGANRSVLCVQGAVGPYHMLSCAGCL